MWEHRTLSLAEQVFERIEMEILTGKYQRGECLTEMKLVSDLGVSRTPVREALHRLEQEHLVDISPKGILVLGVTQQDLEDIFAIRLRIEGMASAAAARRITDEELSELRETLELQEFYVPRKDADRIKGMDSKFHQLIYRFSGSAILGETLLPLHKKVQKFRKASVENESRAVLSAKEHRAIYEAIAAHLLAMPAYRKDIKTAGVKWVSMYEDQKPGVPSSWPGYDLAVGARGEEVRQLQEHLDTIADVYYPIPNIAQDGIYGPRTAEAVRAFQEYFDLPATGVVDFPTWYKISAIYVAVTRIAEYE